MKTRHLLMILIVAISIQANSQESKLLTKTSDLTYCLDSSEFKLGSLYLEAEMADVVEIIGHSDSIRIDSAVFITMPIHYYKGLSIYYVDNVVLAIIADSDKYIMPSGIHTGLSRDKVFEILGLEQNEILPSEYEIEFSGCHNDDYVIQFFFDNFFILRGIVVAVDIL
ncbi:MAG: hypothetical protein K8R53_02910 [Bacteroidales bacterium]|nr:hypothetical protein [Bacteroidales bacterium]